MQTQLKMLRDLGHTVNSDSVLLDLGCGNGELVNEYMKGGYNCYGCDFSFKSGEHVDTLFNEGRIKKVDGEKYRLPFEDNSVDYIFTDQVFEHVKDYATTLSEIHRILKPGGGSLNFFPSRYQVIEPHVYVPFASINKNYYWLLFWASLGIRKRSQRGLSAKETAAINHKYLNSSTYYLTKSQIRDHCTAYFNKVRFSEDAFIKHMRRFQFLSVFSKTRIVPWLYSALRHRVLFLVK